MKGSFYGGSGLTGMMGKLGEKPFVCQVLFFAVVYVGLLAQDVLKEARRRAARR